MQIRYRIHQTLRTQFPTNLSSDEVEDAVAGIEDPDPCLVSDAPEGLVLTWSLESSEVTVENGWLAATRTIGFVLQVHNPVAFRAWCESEGLATGSERLPSYLIEDFEGSYIGDDMVDYTSATEVTVHPTH